MSVEYTYDEEKNVMYTRLFGVVTDKDLRDQGEAVAADSTDQARSAGTGRSVRHRGGPGLVKFA